MFYNEFGVVQHEQENKEIRSTYKDELSNEERIEEIKDKFRKFAKNYGVKVEDINFIVEKGEVFKNPFTNDSFNHWVEIANS